MDHALDEWLSEALRHSVAMVRQANDMRANALEAIQVARQMREYATPWIEQMAKDDVHFLHRYRRSMLTAILDTAVLISGADMGNIQLFDPVRGALHIEAQRGFRQPFLEFFDSVHDGHAVCGTARQQRQQIVVEDVVESPIFLGSHALEVVLDAGVRAVQSTPLVGNSGLILGIVSTHRRRPGRPGARELRQLDLLARTAAEWVECRINGAAIVAPKDIR